MKLDPFRLFLHRLALALGKTIGELETSMSYNELQSWGQYYAEEPFGEVRGDMRNALLAKIVTDLHFWLAGAKSPHSVTDFMLLRSHQTVEAKVIEVDPKAPVAEKKGARIDEQLLTNLFLVAKPAAKKKA